MIIIGLDYLLSLYTWVVIGGGVITNADIIVLLSSTPVAR